MATRPGDITKVLARVDAGEHDASAVLMGLAYDELRELAQNLMKNQPPGHTLQPTALVHEAALRLLGPGGLEEVRNRSYFFGAMCRAMRRVLVDHARRRHASRRGGRNTPHSLDDTSLDATVVAIEEERGIDLVTLDDALQRLEERSQRQADVVSMRFFGGFTMQEISNHLQVSLSTVESDWRIARAWLHNQLQPTS